MWTQCFSSEGAGLGSMKTLSEMERNLVLQELAFSAMFESSALASGDGEDVIGEVCLIF